MFVIFIFFAVVTIVAFIVTRYLPADGESTHRKRTTKIVAFSALGLTVIFLLASSIQIVSTKNVGIETSFGKTSGHLSNGIHLTAPWVTVTEMDAAIQTDSYTGSSCLDVRIANQQTACVNISIRWRIQPDQADYLFQNYRTFDNVRDSLVTRELTAAVNNQLTNYNPLNSISATSTGAANYPTNPSLTQIATKVTDQMRREIRQQT